MRQQTKRLYEFGCFRLDLEECLLLRDGRPVSLKPKALEMLTLLIENSGRMIEKEELMRRLWPDSFVEEANIAVNISQLRKALGQNVSGEQYIETVPKRGYRFVAAVREIDVAAPSLVVRERVRSHVIIEEQETDDEAELSVARKTRANAIPDWLRTPQSWFETNPLLTIVASSLLTAAVITAYFVYPRSNGRTATPLAPHNLAILPFRNLKPDPETDFLGPSMAEAVINKLSHVRSIIVRPASYVQKYRNQEIDPQTVANELGADKLLIGTFLKNGSDLQVSAQLLNARTGEILWRDTMNLKYEQLSTSEDHVAQQIIKGLQISLSADELERLNLDPPQNALAYDNFLRGRYLISNEHQTAIRLLEESVRLDPNYALAWTYLGKAYSISASQYFGGKEFHEKAQAAYDKALALKPQQIETRVLLANFLTENNRVEEAVPMLRKVIEDNPNHPFARWELSYAYRYAGMLDESIVEGETALTLYPYLTGHLFNTYLYSGQYEKFISSLPMRDDAYTLFYHGLGDYYLKDWPRASFYLDRAYERDAAPALSQIGRALKLGMDGKNRDALELLGATGSKLEKDPFGDGEISYKMAQAYSLNGDNRRALNWLARSIGQGFFCYPYFKSDPLLDHLRSEAQFLTLISQARDRHEQFRRKFF
jgi:DNA-binding winged helix-turn-helix (wHTH) protein/TolB-like protein